MHPLRLGVIARASTAHYAETHKPLSEIGRDLHADYVLDGTVRQIGERFRITASLIDVSNQTQLWTETYQPTMGDVLAMQESVARSVAHALTIEFLPQAAREMQEQAKTNAAAYEAYLRGRFLWRQETFVSLQQAIAQFQRAVELDPHYAPAHVGLADSYILLGTYGFVPADTTIPKGKAAASRALEISPSFSDAYNSLAFATFYYDWDWNRAEILFRKALELNPNNQLAHEFYSSYLHAMSRLDEAEAQNAIAKELDPLSAWVYDDKGWILLSRRRPSDAVAEFQRAIELNPSFPVAHLSLAVAYTRLGRFQEAMDETNIAEDMGADPTRVLEVRGSAQALSGDTAAAKATLGKLLTGKINGRVSPYSVALIYTALGKKQEAIDWLEKAVREKDTWVIWIKVLVEWDPLRSEPGFDALLQQLKL
jgi:serine/threonine-protein kinase